MSSTSDESSTDSEHSSCPEFPPLTDMVSDMVSEPLTDMVSEAFGPSDEVKRRGSTNWLLSRGWDMSIGSKIPTGFPRYPWVLFKRSKCDGAEEIYISKFLTKTVPGGQWHSYNIETEELVHVPEISVTVIAKDAVMVTDYRGAVTPRPTAAEIMCKQTHLLGMLDRSDVSETSECLESDTSGDDLESFALESEQAVGPELPRQDSPESLQLQVDSLVRQFTYAPEKKEPTPPPRETFLTYAAPQEVAPRQQPRNSTCAERFEKISAILAERFPELGSPERISDDMENLEKLFPEAQKRHITMAETWVKGKASKVQERHLNLAKTKASKSEGRKISSLSKANKARPTKKRGKPVKRARARGPKKAPKSKVEQLYANVYQTQ